MTCCVIGQGPPGEVGDTEVSGESGTTGGRSISKPRETQARETVSGNAVCRYFNINYLI